MRTTNNYNNMKVKVSTTVAKIEKLNEMTRLPVALYDLTAGQKREEVGYGYLRG